MKGTTSLPIWECRDLRDTLLALFGYEYGDRPEERLLEIRRERAKFADYLAKLLDVGPCDTMVDLGSGIGLQAEHLADRAKQLHCVDISHSLLDHCRRMLHGKTNVEFHHIPFADLSCLAGKGVNKVLATAVFIHFNVYDLWLYLTELARVLAAGGLIGFDFANAEKIDVTRREWIDHAAMYKQDRNVIQACMNYHGPATVANLLKQAGFECEKTYDWGRSVFVVARRC